MVQMVPLQVDVLQFINFFSIMRKTEFKRSSSIPSSLFFSCSPSCDLTTNGNKSIHLGRPCCHQNFFKIKLYIKTLPLIKLLSYWQQCVASFSAIPF